MRHTGWLLDTYLEGGHAHLWFRMEKGSAVEATERHRPHLLAEPMEASSLEELRAAIEESPLVYSAREVTRFTDLRRDTPSSMLEIRVDSVDELESVERFVRGLRQLKEVYDSGLAPVQWYLIERGVAPTSLCEFEEDGGILRNLRALDDSDTVSPPPFKVLCFKAPADGEVDEVEVYDGNRKLTHTLRGSEKEVIQAFKEVMDSEDPDIIVTDDVAATVRRIMRRARGHGLAFGFGRSSDGRRGRILLGLYSYLDMGLAGLTERARFTIAPMGLSGDWEAGKTIDSRQCYEAYRLGVAVPDMKGGVAFESDAWDLVRRDRGGMLFTPQPGLHENVGCLDFESMFPNLICRRNISYETVTEDGVDLSRPGFMGGFTREFLDRRLRFKHLRGSYAPGSREWVWCEERQRSLKLMLVVVYGYSGCYANRFANVRVFQEINRQARQALVRALNVSMERGFEVVYGDTDALFVKRLGASKKDYDDLAAEIGGEVDLPIKLDKHFKFLVLLRKKTDPQQTATRRYYGRLTDGSLFYRGIELRKHDTPPYIKGVQERAMATLLDAEDAEDVLRRGIPRAKALVNRALGEIRARRVETRELVVSRRLRRELFEYRSFQAHVVAALLGGVEDGDSNFVYVNSERKNPYMRVMPAYMLDDASRGYDWRRYSALARRAASNILGPFTDEFDEDAGNMRIVQLSAFL